MAEATITISDAPDGTQNVSMSFGERGFDENSPAHLLAARAIEAIAGCDDTRSAEEVLGAAEVTKGPDHA